MKRDLYISTAFLVVIHSFALFLSSSSSIDYGAEYRCIAEALLRGDGFSDPFCAGAGNGSATAWMPPFLSYLQASVYLIFGLDSSATVWVLMMLSSLALSATLFMLLRLAGEINQRYRHLCVILFLGYILIDPGLFIMSFHDVWLISLLCMSIPYVLYFHFIKKSISVIPVIALALVLPLISPIASFSFVCLVGFLFVMEQFQHLKQEQGLRGWLESQHRSVLKYMSIALFFLLPVFFWGTRNYLSFQKFIPVKSNMWFDFYQANVYDEDGLITRFTFSNFHPFVNEARRQEYQQIGELPLMDSLKNESLAYVKENRLEYLEKVKNRFISALVYAMPPNDEKQQIATEEVSSSDLALLKSLRIISVNKGYNQQMDEAVFFNAVNNSALEDKTGIIRRWQQAREAYSQQNYAPVRIIKLSLISGIPFMAWLISLWLIRKQKSRQKMLFSIISLCYFAFLFPYILISIYTRYQLPLAPVFCLLIYGALVMMLQKIIKSKPTYVATDLATAQHQAV